MAWLTGWSYRKKLTVDHSKVDSDCSDFPVKVILDDDNFDSTKALSTGNDIRFTSSDGETLLKYERELHQFSTTKWDGFQGLVTGSSSFDISNADYIAVTSSRKGLMHKYARLATSIDASGDFAFQFGLYLASYSFNMYGSITNIGLDASGDGYYTGEYLYGNEEYLGIAVAYDTDTNAKPYVYGIFENTRDKTTGYALNSTTQYIIKLSKTGTTLKTAVCSSDGTELWSNTATASTTPTLSYYKVVNRFWIDASSSYWKYRLSDFYNGATEDTLSFHGAVYHVKVPTASSTSNTDVYMYYGKADASDGADPTNVWDGNYELIMHMDSSLEDSTSNSNDGTNSGSALGLASDGYYRSFDGGANIGGIVLADMSEYTMTAYCNVIKDTSDIRSIVGGRTSSTGYFNNIFLTSSTGELKGYRISSETAFSTGYTDVAGKQCFAMRQDNSEPTLWANGDKKGTGSGQVSYSALEFVIGRGYSGRYYKGAISEVRVSSTARSDAWIKATYASLADTLLTYGSEEAVPRTPRVMVVWA